MAISHIADKPVINPVQTGDYFLVERTGSFNSVTFLQLSGQLAGQGVAGPGTTQAGLTGSGIVNYIPKWISTGGLGNSVIFESGYKLGFGTTNPTEQIEITGNINLPLSTSSAGIIKKNGVRYLHGYGIDSVYLGDNAGNFNAPEIDSTYIGANAGVRASGTVANTFIGAYSADWLKTGTFNTAVGDASLSSIGSGYRNTAIGGGAIGGSVLSDSSRCNDNVAVGYRSSISIREGQNTSVGTDSLGECIVGTGNVTLGYKAGAYLLYGSNNTFIGNLAGTNNFSYLNLTGTIAIGHGAIPIQNNTALIGGTGGYAVNVGIGTNTPASRLDVSGQITIRGGSPGIGKVLTSDSTGLATWQTSASSNLVSGISITGSNSLTGLVSFTGSKGVSLINNGNQIIISGVYVSGNPGFGQVLANSSDTNADYLISKIIAGQNMSISLGSFGGQSVLLVAQQVIPPTSFVTGLSITGSSSLTGLISVTGAGNVSLIQNGNNVIISGQSSANSVNLVNLVTGSGTAGTIAKFSNTNSGLVNSSLSEASSILTSTLAFQPQQTLRKSNTGGITSGIVLTSFVANNDQVRLRASGYNAYDSLTFPAAGSNIGEQKLIISDSGVVTILNSGIMRLNGDWIGSSGNSLKVYWDGISWWEEYRFPPQTGSLTGSDISNLATKDSLTQTGQLLYSYSSSISGNLIQSGISLGTRIDGVITNLYTTGSNAYNYSSSISGNLISTGISLGSRIDTVSTNLTSTGSAAYNFSSSISGNLASTGSLTDNKINSFSGNAVLTSTNQLITGIKNFIDSGQFANVIGSGLPVRTQFYICAPTGGPTRLVIDSFNSADSFGSSFRGRKARGEPNQPTRLLNGDVLLQLVGDGFNSGAYRSAPISLSFQAGEDWTTGTNATYLIARTSPPNFTGSPPERFRIDPSGRVGIGTSTPQYALDVSGSGNFASGLMVRGTEIFPYLFSRGGTLLNETGLATGSVMSWRAQYPCTLTGIFAYGEGGSSCSVNARKNGSLLHLTGSLSVPTNSWTGSGIILNASYNQFDYLEIMLTANNLRTEVTVQCDFSRP